MKLQHRALMLIVASFMNWGVIDAAEVSPPTFMVGGNAPASTETCAEEFEGVPSATGSGASSTNFIAAVGRGRFARSVGGWDNWDKDTNQAWPVPRDVTVLSALRGDAWSTFSERNDLAYVSFIGRRPNGASCFAVAAGTPSELAQTPPVWRHPARCAVNRPSDLPRMYFDDDTRTLWLVAKNAGTRINIFQNCRGFPGDDDCEQTAQIGPISPDGVKFGAGVNPCTGNLVLVTRDSEAATSNMRMRFFTNTGTRNGKNFILNSTHRWGTNAGCTRHIVRRCNQGSQTCGAPEEGTCMRMNGMPSLATKQDPATSKCYAAVAYDAFYGRWIKSRLDLVDITDESKPAIVKSRLSTDTTFRWNQYLSHVTISANSKDIGWFWLSDNRGACNVGIEGAVDSNLGLQTMSATGKFDDTFPAIHFNNPSGINDYNHGVVGGGEDGFLYPSWGAAVCTSSSNCGPTCTFADASCTRWSLAAKIARIRPSAMPPKPHPECATGRKCCERAPAGGCFLCVPPGASCK